MNTPHSMKNPLDRAVMIKKSGGHWSFRPTKTKKARHCEIQAHFSKGKFRSVGREFDSFEELKSHLRGVQTIQVTHIRMGGLAHSVN